jgi:Flp pilus assembly secretin CpaC
MLYSSKLNLGATIQDLESKQILQILAEPTITTLSGEKAAFLSGGEFPFPIVQPGGTGSSPVVTIQFRQYGVKLEFTPIVNDDGTIRLTVAPEVSSLDYSNSVTIAGFTIPALSTRRAETQVELRSDQSFAISGLLDQRTTDLLSKTPGIASIPILGTLFKSKNVNHSTTELVVIVTPTLVDPLSETAEPAQPELPIPTLNKPEFDNSLGKDKNPHPAPPPINPEQPGAGNQPPAAAGTSPTGTTPAAGKDAKPARTTPSSANPSSGDAASGAAANTSGNSTAGSGPVARSMVQIMTLSSSEDAESVAAALKRAGYNVTINHDPKDPLFHLEMGPFNSTLDAEFMRHRLVLDGYNAIVQ